MPWSFSWAILLRIILLILLFLCYRKSDLLVCGCSPDIGMVGKRLTGLDFLAEGEEVESGLEDLLDDGIVIRTEEGSAFNSLDQPLPADFFLVTQDTHAAPVSRFRVRSYFQNAGDIFAHNGRYGCRPADELIWVPLANELVGGRHMVMYGGVPIPLWTAGMISNSFLIVKDRDCGG